MQLLQKTFAIKGFPKCLIGSWSKNRARRLHLLNVLSGVKQVSSRYLGDTDVGTGIRDPKLAESVAGPRLYLKQRGANTTCKNDCSGNGFCANATSSGYSCLCQEGWTGDDCTIPVIEVASIGALSGGVSTRAGKREQSTGNNATRLHRIDLFVLVFYRYCFFFVPSSLFLLRCSFFVVLSSFSLPSSLLVPFLFLNSFFPHCPQVECTRHQCSAGTVWC